MKAEILQTPPAQDWRWGTPEGSREFDRLTDNMLTFNEKLQWLEEAENLTLIFEKNRQEREQKSAQDKA